MEQKIWVQFWTQVIYEFVKILEAHALHQLWIIFSIHGEDSGELYNIIMTFSMWGVCMNSVLRISSCLWNLPGEPKFWVQGELIFSISLSFPEVFCVHTHHQLSARTHSSGPHIGPVNLQPQARRPKAKGLSSRLLASLSWYWATGQPSISFDVNWITKWLKKGGPSAQELHSKLSRSASYQMQSECAHT